MKLEGSSRLGPHAPWSCKDRGHDALQVDNISLPVTVRIKRMALSGSQWSHDENQALLDAYFAMLLAELSGRKYVKAEFNRQVQEATGHSKGSVEFKFCNVSAALSDLQQPYVRGYRPRHNFQASLMDQVLAHPQLPVISAFGLQEKLEEYVR